MVDEETEPLAPLAYVVAEADDVSPGVDKVSSLG